MKHIFSVMYRIFLYIFFVFFISGCSSTATRIFNEKNISKGIPIKAIPGDVIASELTGTVESTRKWVGVMNSEDGWSSDAALEFSDDYLEKKLFYQGFLYPDVYLIYKEYRQGSLQPSIDKTEKVNFIEDPFIQVGQYYIGIESITNSDAVFKLYNEPEWKVAREKFFVEKENSNKLAELKELVKSCYSYFYNATSAKEYSENFPDIVSAVPSFSDFTHGYVELGKALNEIKESGNNYSPDELLIIFQQLENELSKVYTFFSQIATALEAREQTVSSIENSNNSFLDEQTREMVLKHLLIGDKLLQSERFSDAKKVYFEIQ